MPLINIIVILVVLGIVWYIFSTYVLPKLREPFGTLIVIVLALAACLWLLSLIGIVGPLRVT